MEQRSRSPLRLLAPAALACFVLALVVVLGTVDETSDTGQTGAEAQRAEERDLGTDAEGERAATREDAEAEDEGLPDDVYVVKEGDTLGGIAEQVGISVERLQELNPEIDPQALVSGQQIKLRE